MTLSYQSDGGTVGNASLARTTRIPPSYLAKVMQGLVRAGVVESRRGVGGGFRLVANPEHLTLLDVVSAVEPVPRIKGCPLGLKSHCERLCAVHARLDEAMAQVEKVLAEATIADLLRDPTRPPPMLETYGFPVQNE